MLHIKFRGNRPNGSGEEILRVFYHYMGVAAILVMCPKYCIQNFNATAQGGST